MCVCVCVRAHVSCNLLTLANQASTAGDQSPDGLVLVWSLQTDSRPEYKFTCQSAVLTAMFDPFDPKLIFGGTYSGQVRCARV